MYGLVCTLYEYLSFKTSCVFTCVVKTGLRPILWSVVEKEKF